MDFEFISPTDKPALIALSTQEWMAHAKAVLTELGYKVHLANNHEDFETRFRQIQYQVVVLEEKFASDCIEGNLTLQALQQMPPVLRRHALVILVCENCQSLNPWQAFQQSVQFVLNPKELDNLMQVLLHSVSYNDLFMNTFRETQRRIAEAG